MPWRATQAQIAQQLFDTYGLQVVDVGIEACLPSVTLNHRRSQQAERETIATERAAVGKRQAAEIRSGERDRRPAGGRDREGRRYNQIPRRSGADLWTAYKSAPGFTNCFARSHTLGTMSIPTLLSCAPMPRRSGLIDGHPAPRVGRWSALEMVRSGIGIQLRNIRLFVWCPCCCRRSWCWRPALGDIQYQESHRKAGP